MDGWPSLSHLNLEAKQKRVCTPRIPQPNDKQRRRNSKGFEGQSVIIWSGDLVASAHNNTLSAPHSVTQPRSNTGQITQTQTVFRQRCPSMDGSSPYRILSGLLLSSATSFSIQSNKAKIIRYGQVSKIYRLSLLF